MSNDYAQKRDVWNARCVSSLQSFSGGSRLIHFYDVLILRHFKLGFILKWATIKSASQRGLADDWFLYFEGVCADV